jgi:hypothetical protein
MVGHRVVRLEVQWVVWTAESMVPAKVVLRAGGWVYVTVEMWEQVRAVLLVDSTAVQKVNNLVG